MKQDLVIAGTDGSQQSFPAVEWAAHEATMRGARLQIVCVPALPPPMSWQRSPEGTPEHIADIVIQAAEEALVKAAEHAAQAEPGLAVETGLRSGPPALALTRAADGASLLVVGFRGSGSFPSLFPGSVSRYLAARATCPVVVVPEETAAVHREVVVGVRDFDQTAAIGFAFEEALQRRARLRALHAWRWFLPASRPAAAGQPAPAAEDITEEAAWWLAQTVALWREKYPEVDVVEDVEHASAARALAAKSAGADLLVLGRNACGDIRHPATNAVVRAVLSHAHCPVAVVPE